MRQKNEMKLGDAIQAYLKAMGLDKKLKEKRLIDSWEVIMGKSVANATERISIYNQVLFVHLNSSVIKHQLQMMKTSILNALNDKAGEKLINKIVFK